MTKMEKDIEQLANLIAAQNALEAQIKELKSDILTKMEKDGKSKVAVGSVSVTYVAATDKVSFDTTSFKKKHPDMYNQFKKTSAVSAYIKVAVKG